jgi:hypothetical protein
MPIPVQLHNSLVPVRVRYVPVQLCRTTTTTRVLYTSTTTVPVPIILGKLYSVQPYSRTRTLNLKRSQKVTKTTVFVCWNIVFKKSIWNRFAAGTRLERHTCSTDSALYGYSCTDLCMSTFLLPVCGTAAAWLFIEAAISVHRFVPRPAAVAAELLNLVQLYSCRAEPLYHAGRRRRSCMQNFGC